MADKRFTLKTIEEMNFCECTFLQNGEPLSMEEVVDLLNQLYDENEQLKSQRNKDAKEFSKLFQQNGRLQMENAQWKQKVNGLLWILGQFDEGKVKKLLRELDDG